MPFPLRARNGPLGTSFPPIISGSAALVARILTNAIESLHLQYPAISDAQRAAIAEGKKQLEAELTD